MNDFTKEELIEISEACHYWHEGCETKIHDKIKSLIENYCEHKYYLQGVGEGCYAQCHKCGQICGVNTQATGAANR